MALKLKTIMDIKNFTNFRIHLAFITVYKIIIKT